MLTIFYGVNLLYVTLIKKLVGVGNVFGKKLQQVEKKGLGNFIKRRIFKSLY